MGKAYQGRPLGLAFRLWKYEQNGQPEKAVALLKAENLIRSAFGRPPYDLARDFTVHALEGVFLARAR
jgi:hypothetical protein